jgi:hypothetical protein
LDGESFLVTAAHVIEQFRNNELHLRIGVGSPQRPEPTPVTDEYLKMDEKNDVALLRLPDSIVAQLSDRDF